MNSRNQNLGNDNSMDLKLNENQLKISGRCNILSGLTLGKNYDLTIGDVECRKSEDIPNDDGTRNVIYTLKLSPMSEVNIIDEKEIIQTKKKKGSQSQVLRMKIEERWEQMGSEMDKEAFYVREMSRIISNY